VARLEAVPQILPVFVDVFINKIFVFVGENTNKDEKAMADWG
jgi:hypothetical protein